MNVAKILLVSVLVQLVVCSLTLANERHWVVSGCQYVVQMIRRVSSPGFTGTAGSRTSCSQGKKSRIDHGLRRDRT